MMKIKLRKNDGLMDMSALSDTLVPNVESSSEPMGNKMYASDDAYAKDSLCSKSALSEI